MQNGNLVSFVATEDMMPLAKSVRDIVANNNLSFQIRDVVPVEIKRFADNVSLATVKVSIRRTEVYVFYSPPLGNPDVGFAELQKILNAVHFASPQSVILVLPNFWEGRADRKSEARVSMNTKELALLIDRYAETGLITFDLHAPQIMLAFNKTPVDDLKGQVLHAAYCREKLGWDPSKVGVVAADDGGVKRATKFAQVSGFPYKGHVYKERTEANVAKAKRYIGEPVNGLHIIMPDDIVDTGGTIASSGGLILSEGAASVTACVSHWIASAKDDPSNVKLRSAEAKFRHAGMKVIALNTIPRTDDYIREHSDFLTVIPCDGMLADAIAASLTPGASVSELSDLNKK
jgi:ribose-phosphate pyrophosphokinase